MKKIILLFSGFMMVCGLSSLKSQITPGYLTVDQHFIKKTTDSVLFVIRQDYVIRDTIRNTDYGRGGNEYFGRYYGLAILAENRLWCDSKIISPWLYDPNYAQFRNNDTLRPVLKNSAIRKITGKQFHPYSLKIDTVYDTDSVYKNVIAFFYIGDSLKSIKIEHNTHDTTGWLVLAYTSKNISLNDTCDIQVAEYRPCPEYDPAEPIGRISPPAVSQHVLGGFYFSTHFSVGIMEVKLAGLFYKKLLNWYLQAIPTIKEPLVHPQNLLTPVQGDPAAEPKKRKTKNSTTR